jgi:hypothetical protein
LNSLKAFLSTFVFLDDVSNLQMGELNLLVQNSQPIYVFDSSGRPQAFTVFVLDDPESLSREDVRALASIIEQPEWLVIVDHSNRIYGLVEPMRTEDLRAAAYSTIKSGSEFGSITPLDGKIHNVSVTYYSCAEHPQVRYALHQIGMQIPNCPYDGKPLTKLQEKHNPKNRLTSKRSSRERR